MASFRDPLQPERVHFPGCWRTRILIGAGLFLLLLTGLLAWWFEDPGMRGQPEDWAMLLLAALWLLACWPREIVCGPAAVEQRQWLGLRKVRIRWDEEPRIEQTQEFGGVGRLLGLAASAVAVAGPEGVIRHTPRHADAERFLQECRRRTEECRLRRAAAARPQEPVRAQEEKKS